MKDVRLNALVVLVNDWLPCLNRPERQEFMRALRNGWCERCGHTENQTCKDGECESA